MGDPGGFGSGKPGLDGQTDREESEVGSAGAGQSSWGVVVRSNSRKWGRGSLRRGRRR